MRATGTRPVGRLQSFPLIAGAIACALAAGCARYAPDELLGAGTDVSPTGDRAERPVLSVSGPPLDVKPVRVSRVEEGLPGPGPSTIGEGDVEGAVGSPAVGAAPAQAVASGPAALVDAKVGDINGRPVFVSDFFAGGLGDRLAEKAREKGITREAWLEFAGPLIGSQVALLERDELLEAEARASLKAPQRQGLRAFAQEYGEKARRGRGGSRSRLERGLMETYNLSYEQFVRMLETDLLIKMQYEKMVESRVFITSRDISRYYERNFKTYNPDPRARFRLIRVRTERADDVNAVRAALERGEPFATVAAMPINTSGADVGGLQEKPFTGERKDAEFFAVPELNQAARTLEPGRWEALTYGPWSAWLFLESVEVVSRPLANEQVQLDIIDALSAQKEQEVAEKYLNRLRDRASLGDVPRIRMRLMQVAVLRYWESR